jgi:surfactin synthase thioesterase subunit
VSADAWLRRYAAAPAGAHRLICLPHAGGSASFFRPVALALASDVDVRAVQYPGRQDRRGEPFVPTVVELADRVAEAVLPLADRPLIVFGHSMGATLGFETVRRLEAAGSKVAGLFASGRVAPSRQRAHEQVHRRGDPGLLAELRTLDGTDGQVFADPELVEMIMPAVRNDYRAIETYRCAPGATVSCPIHALIGADDPKVTEDEAGAWAGHTTGAFSLTTFPGGHFYLTHHMDRILALVRAHHLC